MRLAPIKNLHHQRLHVTLRLFKKKSLHNKRWQLFTSLYVFSIDQPLYLPAIKRKWLNQLIQIHAPTCHNYTILSHRNDHSDIVFRWLPNVYQQTNPSFIEKLSCDLWLAVHLPSIKITNWTLFSRCSCWCSRFVAYPRKTSENRRFAWKKPTSKPMTKSSPLLILYHRQHPLFLHNNGRTKNKGHRTDHVAMWYISPKNYFPNMYIIKWHRCRQKVLLFSDLKQRELIYFYHILIYPGLYQLGFCTGFATTIYLMT